MIKNIFFDFDGVLAESVNVKTQAFRNLYLEFGDEVANKVVEHHLLNGGISRFEKIRTYHKDLLNTPLDEKGIMEWADKFSDLVLKGVIEAEEVLGSQIFLDNHSKDYNCWVITGTPTDEIKIILKARNWNSYFKEAYGSPEKKNHWTEYLIEKHNLKREETVFIGDASADYEAAQFSNLHFILRRTDENGEIFKDYVGHEMTNLTEFNKLLKSI
jgi:HAD superfamily hydrolase (TIGR01549 family)